LEVRVLFLGDIVGAPGLRVVKDRLPELRNHLDADLVVANGENIANGSGITRALARDLFRAEVDVVTLGDHAYAKRDHLSFLSQEPRIVRPANYPPGAAGRELAVVDLPRGGCAAIFQLQGRVFLPPTDCPFRAADRIIQAASARTPILVCDMHAEATSEMIAMGWHLDGRVSAVLGTHTHVQTADERILPDGTAYITDVGMTGPYDSVIGRKRGPVLQKFLTNVPAFFSVATDDVRISGAFVTVDADTGHAVRISRLHLAADGELAGCLQGPPSHD